MLPDFPRERFDRIQETINQYRDHPNHIHFVGAWRAVELRYRAVAEYDERFTASLVEQGPGPGDRYFQERDLFGFASNAYSMFDAFHYAMYAIGSVLRPALIALNTEEDERKVSFRSTQKAFLRAFEFDPIVEYFIAFAADPDQADLYRLRNMLTHRAIPPRNFRLAVGGPGKPSASIGRLNIELDRETTRSRRRAVTRLLTGSMKTLDEFIDRNIAAGAPD